MRVFRVLPMYRSVCCLASAAVATLVAAMTIYGADPARAQAHTPPIPPAAAPKAKKKPVVSKTTSVLALPTGHLAEHYETRILGIKGIDIADFNCNPMPILPNGLKLICKSMTIEGVPEEAVKGKDVHITVSDTSGGEKDMHFTLTIIDGPDVVRVDGKQATANPAPQKPAAPKPPATPPATPIAAAPDTSGQITEITALRIELTSPVQEGISSLSGIVQKLPPKTTGLTVQLRLTDQVGRTYLEPLKPVKGSTHDLQTAVAEDGTFTLNFTSPLPDGVKGRPELVGSDAIKVLSYESPEVAVKPFLPLPEIRLTTLLRDGVSVIAGTYGPVPDPAIATSASSKPPVTGNLPRVVILLHDANAPEGDWYRAGLQVGSPVKTQDYREALSTGEFSVLLKSPLAPGQRVRVQMVPPVGRRFHSALGTTSVAEWTEPDKDGDKVYSSLGVVPPVITSHLVAYSGTITGTATPSIANGATVNVAVVSDDDYHDLKLDGGEAGLNACLKQDELKAESGRFLPLTLASGTGAFGTTNTTGNFSLTLATPLIEGQRFHVVEILPANSRPTTEEQRNCTTTVTEVKGEMDWGRIHADFVGGVLISNDSSNSTAGAAGAGSGNFSQAHQFVALNVEKTWSLPACYLRVFTRVESTIGNDGKRVTEVKPDQCFDWRTRQLDDASRWQHLWPGVSTYFQARLTAIPVSTLASGNTMTTNGTTTATAPTTNLLTTAQTAKVEVGAYFPFLISRWEFNRQPNALFIAPLGKVGFNTVTGPSTVNSIAPGGTAIQSQTFEQVYNFWSYGARIGHMELTHSQNRAPETYSYLDISIGPYSNLQSYICHGGGTRSVSPSTCAQYPGLAMSALDSRKRLYRLDIEGLLKIPKTLFYVGLNANVGQKTLGATNLDQGFAAPDDLRFFFDTKFDIASVLAKYKLGPQ